jgi:DNA modification methylase
MQKEYSMEKLVWSTEKRKVKDLIPYEFNPRKRNEDKQSELKKSLEDFNLVDTPVLNIDGVLISGQRRLEALIELGRGEDEIDVRIPNRLLTADEVKRYCLLANTHAGEWDMPKLETHFSDIYQDIVDLPSVESNVLDVDSVDKDKDREVVVVEDEFDEEVSIQDPITKKGDIYELNDHRIMCGDSTDLLKLKELMNNSFANMIFTDPPYNVKVSNIVGLGKTKHDEFEMASGEMNQQRFTRFLEDVFINLIKVSTDGSIHYICMDWKHINELTNAGKIYSRLMNLIVWVKDNGGMGTFYRSKHELIFIYKNGKAKHTNNFQLGQTGRYRTNVWEYSGMNSFKNKDRELLDDHPTVKPVKLVADAILDCSSYNDIILDVFLVS